MPLVSVIIPSYNRSHLIGETIESVLSQTFNDFELIVVDDGSTDNTREVVDRYGRSVKYIYQRNQGRSAARNQGIKAAGGELIAFIDSDDLWLPDKLYYQVEMLANDVESGLVYTDYEFVDSRLSPLSKPPIYVSHPLREGRILEHLLTFDFIPPSTVMVRRECLNVAGLFDTGLRLGTEDWDFLLRLVKLYKVSYVKQACALIRVHEGNTAPHDIASGTIQVLLRHLQQVSTKKALGDKWQVVYRSRYRSVGDYYYNRGQMQTALKYYLKALRVCPLYLFDTQMASLLVKTVLGKKVLSAARSARKALLKP
jgi:glycosyltransferase involved in cell wall biosynthesis